MRYAIISDIHANHAALRAVLADASDMRADEIICLGDVLGYGPDPVPALELVHRRAHVCLAGNHDDAASSRFPIEDFTDFAAEMIRAHRALLSQSALHWLRSLPHSCEFPNTHPTASNAFACTHGDFTAPKNFEYVLEPAHAAPSFSARPEPLLFAGHTHSPAVFALSPSGEISPLPPQDFSLAPGFRYFVNPGSVGYPRTSFGRSSYCIFDSSTLQISFRSLPFDPEAYTARMREQGFVPASWILARFEEAASRPNLRAPASFGEPTPAQPEPAPQPAEPATAPEPSTPPRPPVERSILFLLGLAAFAAALWFALRPAPPPPDPPPPPSAQEPTSITNDLSGGWLAVTPPNAPLKIKPDYNNARELPVFRIAAAAPSSATLLRQIPLSPATTNLFFSFHKFSNYKRGNKSALAFTAQIDFLDSRDKPLGTQSFHGKISCKEDKITVPKSAAAARLSIDCRFSAPKVYDLAIHFKTEPNRNPIQTSKTKPKE